MKKLLVLWLGMLSLPAICQKHPLTFAEMMKLKRVEEPVPSPDGKWVLFAAVEVDLASNSKTPHVWMVPAAGGPAKQIISDQDADRPRWAPDGKRFAFLSTKQGGSQVWIADFDEVSATVTDTHKLTSVASEAGGELWSPDGKHILFTSMVYPECDGPPAQTAVCNARKLADANRSKVKAQIFTHLLYRHWNGFQEGKRSHLLLVEIPPSGGGIGGFSSDVPRDLTPGDFNSPVYSVGGQDNYAFSPGGEEICYASNHDRGEATSTNNDLWILPVNGGPARNISSDNPASDSTPSYSPDGKYIAYRAQSRPGYEGDRFQLMIYDRDRGEKRSLTEAFDRRVGTLVWAPDSQSIYFSAENRGQSPIYWLPLDPPGNWPQALVDGSNDDMAVAGGQTILFTRMALGFPAAIYAARARGPGDRCPSERPGAPGATPDRYPSPPCPLPEVALTHLNDALLSSVSLSRLESFWFRGALNDQVQGFLVKPPDFEAGRKYPVKFLIHGGPQSAWGEEWSYRWNAQLFAAGGYVVIMINPHGSTGYGQKFTDAVNRDWGGAPFEDLMKGLDYAEQHYPFLDRDRECALGASYGGYMTNWILGHSHRFRCIVTHDGMFNTESAWGTTEELWFNEWEFAGTPYGNREMYRKWSPHRFADQFETPTLVIHGQKDYRLDVSEGFQLFTTLQRRGVPSKMLYFPDEGHWILQPQNSELWYKTVNDWVEQWTR